MLVRMLVSSISPLLLFRNCTPAVSCVLLAHGKQGIPERTPIRSRIRKEKDPRKKGGPSADDSRFLL